MAHICVIKLTIIGSDNGLLPERRQTIIWTNAAILLIQNLGTTFSETLGEIHTPCVKNMHKNIVCGMAAKLSRHQCKKPTQRRKMTARMVVWREECHNHVAKSYSQFETEHQGRLCQWSIDFDPAWVSYHTPSNVGWNYICIPKPYLWQCRCAWNDADDVICRVLQCIIVTMALTNGYLI